MKKKTSQLKPQEKKNGNKQPIQTQRPPSIHKFENLEEMDGFLHAYNLLRYRHIDIENLNGKTTNSETKPVINTLSRRKSQRGIYSRNTTTLQHTQISHINIRSHPQHKGLTKETWEELQRQHWIK